MYGNHRSVERISVAKLILQETGTHNPMYFRPYETHVDAYTMDVINNRVEQSPSKITDANVFSGIASNVISPSATVGPQISIPYGWNERRIRFIMEVHVQASIGTPMVYYFQGFTNYLGISNHNGKTSIDPNMEFIINSYIRVSRLQKYGVNGLEYVDKIVESAHVVNGQIMTETIHDQIPGLETGIYALRPQDIFTGISHNNLRNGYETMGHGASKNAMFFDGRLKKQESIGSSRANGLPSNYIANVINSYQVSTKNQDFGNGTRNVIDMAITDSVAFDPKLAENFFLRALGQVRGPDNPQRMKPTFTINELACIDSNIQNVTNLISLGQTARAALPQAGQTAYWNGADRESVIATVLSNAVPAVMMDLMISKIHFRSTNHDIGGKMNTVIINGASVTNADLTRNYQMFMYRLEREVLFDITFGNNESYMLEMSVDLFGESTVNISLASGPMVTFGTPSFCDSLTTPVATVNRDGFHKICHDFEVMFGNIQEASPTSIVLNSQI